MESITAYVGTRFHTGRKPRRSFIYSQTTAATDLVEVSSAPQVKRHLLELQFPLIALFRPGIAHVAVTRSPSGNHQVVGHHRGSVVQPNYLHVVFTHVGRQSGVGDAGKLVLIVEVAIRTDPAKVVGDRLIHIGNI